METVYFLRGKNSVMYNYLDELESSESYVHIIHQLTWILTNVIFTGTLFAATCNVTF